MPAVTAKSFEFSSPRHGRQFDCRRRAYRKADGRLLKDANPSDYRRAATAASVRVWSRIGNRYVTSNVDAAKYSVARPKTNGVKAVINSAIPIKTMNWWIAAASGSHD